MSGAPTGALLVVAVLALLLAALLSAGETGLLRLGRAAQAAIFASSTPSARRVARLLGEPRAAASAASSVRVSVEALAAVCLVLAVLSVGATWWQTLLVAGPLATVAALIVVRHVPRRVARNHPSAAVLLTSGLLAPAYWLAGTVHLAERTLSDQQDLTDDEIRVIVDRVSDSEHIEDEEREMFRSVLELGDTLTRAVMVPRTEMITVPGDTTVSKALSLFLRSGYSRVPVVGDSVDDVLGVLYLKDLVRHSHLNRGSQRDRVGPLARHPAFVPESKPVDDLLREMQRSSSHIAMVVDEYGGIAGLVTIEDALEEIVGELTDEHDRSGPEVEDLGDGTYRVPSRLPVDELGELFDLDLEDDDVDTVGGLLAKALGKVPLVGASAEVWGLVLTADRVEGRRKQVATLLVRQAGVPTTDPGTGSATTTTGAHR